MAGFIRRYGYFPGNEVITQVEGVVIVDLPPPGSVSGVGTGTVAVIGEFADVSYGVNVATDGTVSTKPKPIEILSAQDLINKMGGFDETLGDTGGTGGNGFIALRNKKFSRLVAVPINLASPNAVRCYRDLPTNKSASDPTPIVPLIAASVPAGREFKTGANTIRTCARASFTAIGAFKQAIDGAVAADPAGVVQNFGSATGAFLTTVRPDGTTGLKAGDIVVIGVIGGAAGLGANAETYRVVSVTSATVLVLEKSNGASFSWTAATGLPYRVHVFSDADSGEGVASSTSACTIPARPLQATFVAATEVAPSVAAAAPTATTWDSLSSLTLRTHPTGSLAYDAAIQAPNVASGLDALYLTCFDALLTDDLPAREVNIVQPARTSTVIRAKQKSHVLEASRQGMGRTSVISPSLATVATTDVIADDGSGVGLNRDERIFYAWPGAQTFIPEAVGFNMKGADGFYHSDGLLDTSLNMWVASVLSLLPPERNPGQSTSPVPDIMSNTLGFQRLVSGLGINDYTLFRQKGVVAMRIDKTAGPIFQSGITTSLVSGQKNIARRRMADFIEDSLAQRLNQFAKQPLTSGLKDTAVGEVDAFCGELRSVNNPAAQRIVGYIVDDKAGNTPEMEAKGIFVIIVKVRTLASADFIVVQAEIGENVNVTAA